jgi:hypothetical protein
MDQESPIRFSADESIPAPSPLTPPVEVAGNPILDERVSHTAKSIATLFGLLLIVVLPIGALMSDHGMLTPAPKPIRQQMPVYTGQSDVGADASFPKPNNVPTVRNQVTPPITGAPSQGNPYRAPGTSTPPAPAANDGSAVIDKHTLSVLVQSVSRSVRNYAANCRSNGGAIRSGAGGERLCSTGDFNLRWPMVSACGTSPADTKWTVFRGDTDTWDITVTCAARPECDGPSNALCTKNGCTFSDSCLPK